MIWQLVIALFVSALLIVIEYRYRRPWTPLNPGDLAGRVGVYVPWLLGVFTLLIWLVKGLPR